MRFANAFELSSYLLLFSGFISLLASEAVGLILTLLYSLMMVLGWRNRFQVQGWGQIGLFLALVGFFLVDALAFSDFVSATLHLLITVSLIKLFTATADRDYQSGDNARFVHWKSSAKLQRLMVKDLAQDQETPLNIAFSTHLPHPTETNLEQFEKAVSHVTSLAHLYRTRGQQFEFNSGEFQVTVDKDISLGIWVSVPVEPWRFIVLPRPRLFWMVDVFVFPMTSNNRRFPLSRIV